MSQPNVTVLVSDRKRKEQKFIVPPYNVFWPHIQIPPTPLITYQQPVRSLTEVPLDAKLSTSMEASNIPPTPVSVEVASGVRLPNTPSTSSTISKTPATADKTIPIAGNSINNSSPSMAKRLAVRKAKKKAKVAAKNTVKHTQLPARLQTNVPVNEKASNIPPTTMELVGGYLPMTPNTSNSIIQTTTNAAKQLAFINSKIAVANKKRFVKDTGKNTAPNNTMGTTVNPSGDATNGSNITNFNTITTGNTNKANVGSANKSNAVPPQILSKRQRKRMNKRSRLLQNTVAPFKSTKDKKDQEAKISKGFTIPKLEPTPKPNIVLKTKKNLQTEMAEKLNTFIKPEPAKSDKPSQNKPKVTGTEKMHEIYFVLKPSEKKLVPTAAKPTKVPGIFVMEQSTQALKENKRERYPDVMYAYNYPKGIPRSFLKNQQMTQNPGGQQMTPVPGGQPGQQMNSPIWPNVDMNTLRYNANAPTLGQAPPMAMGDNMNPASAPIFVQTENQNEVQQPYSPSDIYADSNPEAAEELESPETSQNQGAQKRLSAFQRLGPVSQPKKPKLTINLTLNKEQPIREVVNDTDDDPDRYTPVHLRKNIINSTDETVVKYLPVWPWRKNFGIRRSVTARQSRSVMILEQEQMEEAYDKDTLFIQITVKGYPSTWTKERVLDAILDNVRGYSFIPCFVEFYQNECKFLALRSRLALVTLHKTGFYIHKDGVELTITISLTDLSLNQIEFIPRIILRKRVAMKYEDKKLNLSAFCLQEDISHFIYYPINNLTNQKELIKLQSVIPWDQLTELDLSHNRLTNISAFDLNEVAPRLKHLNLSHNYLEKITLLLGFKGLLLKSLRLEGNPLCNDYIDPDHYVKVIRLMFPTVVEIDGIPIHRKGELAHFKQNYCPDDAKEIAEKFLDIYFPLLDSGPEHRSLIQGMYEDDAMLTITYCYKLRYGPIYRCFRNLFLYARFLDEGETDSVVGAMAITKLINRWPHTEHDPFTFTVDVMYHTETTTILRVGGILKLTAETLAEDEHLLSFSRTVVLYSEDGDEYKIHNEMIYWAEPSAASARAAFRVNTISQKKINLKIESTTDEDLRENYLKIFMKLTTMDKKISERCLEMNDWNFKLALEHFTKLLKLNNLDSLMKETPTS